MKKMILVLVFLLQGLLLANVELNYKTCANCHGQEGEKSAMNKSKIINQMTKNDFIAAMKGYKDGSYGGALKGLMKGQAMKLSVTDIEELANKIIK